VVAFLDEAVLEPLIFVGQLTDKLPRGRGTRLCRIAVGGPEHPVELVLGSLRRGEPLQVRLIVHDPCTSSGLRRQHSTHP
jgi:hypothetical protein